MWPILWAQTGPDEASMPILGLRRWFEGLTMGSPESTPRPIGFWCWLAGLGLMMVLALVAQGPRKALGQLIDFPGHIRRLSESVGKLRHAGRLLAVVLGATVVSWTGYQFVHYLDAVGLEGLLLLTRRKSPGELAIEHGFLAALAPARDVLGLGSMLVLLVPATIKMFGVSARQWSEDLDAKGKPEAGSGAAICWLAMGLFTLYKLVELVTWNKRGGMPLGNCLIVEAALVPALMLVADGVLAAWVLSEVSRRGMGGELAPVDGRAVLDRVPAAMVACVAAMPGRYLVLAAYLLLNYPLVPQVEQVLKAFLTGWGPVYLQGVGLGLVGVVGAAAARGGRRGVVGRYWGLMRESGGRLVAWVAICSAGAGLGAGACYLLLLSLPPQPWVLGAADAYAHYVTLPFGLVLVCGMAGLAREAVEVPGVSGRGIEAEERAERAGEGEEIATDEHR